MEAQVVRISQGKMWITLRLWTGQVVRVHRSQVPWRGAIEEGEKLNVFVKTVLVVDKVFPRAES